MPVSPRTSLRTMVAAGAFAAAFVASAGVAQAPGTAPAQAISQRDKQEGAQAHPQLLEEFGGSYSGPQAAYVETIGKNIAVQSGLSNARGDFTVTLLNSPVNNAFAIPGGYIYVTRQLVALMNSEAELAGVLGHEVAHVAARHAARRQSAATKNTILGVLGSVLAGAVLGNSGFGGVLQRGLLQGSQMLTLKYSRGQETEADNLGITYLRRAGYDPRAMGSVLQSLAAQNALDARLMGNNAAQVPAWASTHPEPAARVRAALARAGSNASGTLNRDTFLARIDGVMYGDDPRQGAIDGRTFTHPDLKLTFRAPDGFYLMNGTRAVTIGGQSGKGEFSTAAYSGDLNAYVTNVFAALAGQNQPRITPSSLEKTTVNAIPAVYGMARVTSNGSPVDVVVFAYETAPGQAFHFLTISQAGSAQVFNPMFQSLRRITTAEAGAVRPRKLAVITAKAGDTVQTLSARMAFSDAKVERFLVLNGLSANSRIATGQKVKIITY